MRTVVGIVVRAPGKDSLRNPDLHHGIVGDEGVARDHGTAVVAVEGAMVDHVDATEQGVVSGYDGVAGDCRLWRAKEDDGAAG